MTQEALKLALEALEVSTDWDVNATGKQLKSMQAITALRKALAQEQEPVAWRWGIKKLNGSYEWRYSLNKTKSNSVPLYTQPPQRTWVGLDDDELTEAWHWGGCDPHIEGAHFKALYQYFEAKLKDKNDVAQKTD